jgi:hypothetical protein
MGPQRNLKESETHKSEDLRAHEYSSDLWRKILLDAELQRIDEGDPSAPSIASFQDGEIQMAYVWGPGLSGLSLRTQEYAVSSTGLLLPPPLGIIVTSG